jgi:hypothetical protein
MAQCHCGQNLYFFFFEVICTFVDLYGKHDEPSQMIKLRKGFNPNVEGGLDGGRGSIQSFVNHFSIVLLPQRAAAKRRECAG